MARWLTLIWIVWVGVVSPLGAQQKASGAKDWKQLKYPPLRDVKLPEIKRYTLSNGIRLFVVEDHRLPLVGGTAMIHTGSRWEPAEKTGLASIVGQVMRSGGTATKTGDELDEELEAMAASVETGIGLGSGSAGFSALKGDEDRVLAIFADVLMNPEFRQDKIELAKTFARTAISRRNDEPRGINAREFRKLIYGSESVYARHTEYATIDAIRREDLIEFHRRYYHPNNVMIGISGDIDAEQIRQKVEAAFAAWKPAPELQLPPLPPVEVKRSASVNFIRKQDVNQTTIRIGHLAGRRDDPDYFALRVMTQILAAGPSSRMFKRIRTEMGLAYAATGFWGARYDHPGTFSVFVGTKSETTVEATEAVLHELRLIRETEVTDKELQVAKESNLNSFVFNFADPGQIMSRIMTYIYFGYPEDFLQRYKNNVEQVTKADVLRVARKHLEPDRLTILAVGNDKDFDKPLTKLALAAGKVNTIDITIPEAQPAPLR
jgi:zinc protease